MHNNPFFLIEHTMTQNNLKYQQDEYNKNILDPTGGAHDAPRDLLVGWGADTPPYTSLHTATRLSCPLTPNPGDATGHHHFLR